MDELVELGRTSGAYGFKGWVRIVPFGSGQVLEAVRDWVFVDALGRRTPILVKGLRRRGGGLIAKWDGCETKEAADAVRGRVGVLRSNFPDAGDDAVWAVDLIGCRVENEAGEHLGGVSAVDSNGAQDLLVIEYACPDGGVRRFMIPNVKDVYVRSIDVEAKLVKVDWALSWR